MDVRSLYKIVLILSLAFAGVHSQALSATSKLDRSSIKKIESTMTVLSFKEWKQSRLQNTLNRCGELKKTLQESKTELKSRQLALDNQDPNLLKTKKSELQSRSIELLSIESQLKNEQMNYEMAKDLTVTDYFAGYLSKLSYSKEALKSAAQKLSPEEVAEIMSAFASTTNRSLGEPDIAPTSRLIESKDLEN